MDNYNRIYKNILPRGLSNEIVLLCLGFPKNLLQFDYEAPGDLDLDNETIRIEDQIKRTKIRNISLRAIELMKRYNMNCT